MLHTISVLLYFMRVELKSGTVERIERLTGARMTTRCDKIINQALDIADDEIPEKSNSKPQVKMTPGILEELEDG